MPSWWFLRAKPSEEPTPDDGYDAFFSGDGTEGTTAGTLYRKDFNGVVTPVGTGGGGGGGTYTDEQAQDAVGRILTDTTTVDFTYNDAANTITAVVVPGSIGATQIAAGGVGTGQLAANAVTNAVLADMPGATVKGRPAGAAGDPQDLNATALKALMSFSSTDIGDFTEAAQDAVGAALADSASVHLAYNDTAGTITGQVQTNGITTAMIQANAVTSAQLAADSVTAAKILDGAVGTAELAASSITNPKLANMAAKTFKGNKTTAATSPGDITIADAKAMLAYAASEITAAPFGPITDTTVQAQLQALYALIQNSGDGGGGTPTGAITYSVAGTYTLTLPVTSLVSVTCIGGGGGGQGLSGQYISGGGGQSAGGDFAGNIPAGTYTVVVGAAGGLLAGTGPGPSGYQAIYDGGASSFSASNGSVDVAKAQGGQGGYNGGAGGGTYTASGGPPGVTAINSRYSGGAGTHLNSGAIGGGAAGFSGSGVSGVSGGQGGAAGPQGQPAGGNGGKFNTPPGNGGGGYAGPGDVSTGVAGLVQVTWTSP